MTRKALAALALCAALLLSIMAFGTENHTPPPEEEPPVQPRVVREEGPYIKVGFCASLTGSASLLGQMGQQGCRLAAEEINYAGGINGKEIRLIEYDDQTDPAKAVSIVRKMIEEDQVDAIIGSHTSGNIIRTAPITEQAQVLQIGMGTSYIWTNVGHRYLFRSSGNSKSYDDAIFASVKEAGYRRVAVYYCTTEYAEAGGRALIARIREDPSIKLVWNRSNDITQTDFKEDFLSMKAAEPDAVILYATSENAGTQLKQLREDIGYQGAIYGPECFANSSSRLEAGDNLTGLIYACTNTIPPSPTQAVSEKERAFLENYIRMYGTMPTAETAYRGYDAMMILAETFRRAESLESEDLRRGLLSITDYQGICGTFDFSDGSGDGLHGCQVITMLDRETMERRLFSDGGETVPLPEQPEETRT